MSRWRIVVEDQSPVAATGIEKLWLSLTEAARLVDEAELMVLLATFKP